MSITLFSIYDKQTLEGVKYKGVDDTTVLELLLHNSISILNLAVRDTHNFFIEPKMKLNPLKSKEMLINFMKYPNNIIQAICIGNHQLEHVSTFKLLGVKIRHHLKLKDHIDYIYSKATKRFA